jgi:hypothetical protein
MDRYVVILAVMYVRTIKVPSSNGTVNEYVRVVESYRENGKVKQRVVADLGRKDLLAALLPRLRRVLEGTPVLEGQAEEELDILDASTWGPVLVVRRLFEQLGLWEVLDRFLGAAKTVPFADRAFVLVANRLIHPKSEHGLAGWLETDFLCDRQGRRFVPRWQQRRRVRVHHQQLDAWYRTLDQLVAAKAKIELALYQRLRDLFSLKPELVLYDITSTYFEGAGPEGLARHGYSRDGKPQNVQVIVGVVMVNGWPIAHHVWEGNRLDHSTVLEVVQDLRQRFCFSRVVFVGDRGMVTDDTLAGLKKDEQGYLVGIKRRRNAQFDEYVQLVDETKWSDCPMGVTAREKKPPPKTRVQEVAPGEDGVRAFVIDSEERRQYEEAMRTRSMEKTREKLESVRERVARGDLVEAAKIGAAALRPPRASLLHVASARGRIRVRAECEPRTGETDGGQVRRRHDREGPRRVGGGADLQGTDRGRTRLPAPEGRAGVAADLSPRRVAGERTHLRRGLGAAGGATAGAKIEGGGGGPVRSRGVGGDGHDPAGDFSPARSAYPPRTQQRLSARPASA